jgi:hypothetical protein
MKFVPNPIGDYNLAIEAIKQIKLADGRQVGDGRRVAYDNHKRPKS